MGVAGGFVLPRVVRTPELCAVSGEEQKAFLQPGQLPWTDYLQPCVPPARWGGFAPIQPPAISPDSPSPASGTGAGVY